MSVGGCLLGGGVVVSESAGSSNMVTRIVGVTFSGFFWYGKQMFIELNISEYNNLMLSQMI